MPIRGHIRSRIFQGNDPALLGGSVTPEDTLSNYTDQMSFWSDTLDMTNNLWTDKSGNDNDLNLVAANAFNPNNAVHVTEAAIPANLKFTNAQPFTISLKTKIVQSTNAYSGLFGVSRFNEGYGLLLSDLDASNVSLKISLGGLLSASTTLTFANDTVVDITFVYDPGLTIDSINNVHLYANASATHESFATPTLPYTTDEVNIGSAPATGFLSDASIWDLRIWSGVVLPAARAATTPLYEFPLAEGYGDFVHDKINGTRWGTDTTGQWATQDATHNNLEYGATKISYGGNDVWVPYDSAGDPIYNAAYISANGNYLNAAEVVVECLPGTDVLTQAETKAAAPLGLPDQANLLYEVGGDPVQYGIADITSNVDEHNFIMRNDSTFSDIIIWDEALFDDVYLTIAPLFDITVTFNEMTILSGGGGDYVSIEAALADLTATKTNRYRLNISEVLTEVSLIWESYFEVVGDGRATSEIYRYLDPTVELESAVSTNTTIEIRVAGLDGVRISGLTLRVKNGKYALHNDIGSSNSDQLPGYMKISDCDIIHEGNEECWAEYSNQILLDRNGSGLGLTDNMKMVFENCYSLSKGGPVLDGDDHVSYCHGWRIHGKTSSGQRSKVYLTDCQIEVLTPRTQDMIISNGFGNQDEYYFDNVQLVNSTWAIFDDGAGYTDNTTEVDGYVNGSLIDN